MPRSVALLGILAIINFIHIAPYVLPGVGDAQASSVKFRILTANVSQRNEDYEALRELIEQLQPDIVGLIEMDEEWTTYLSEVAAEYAYKVLRPEEGVFGLVLLSRFPVREQSASPYVHAGIQTAILAEIDIGKITSTIILTHAMPPTRAIWSHSRNEQLAKLATYFQPNGETAGILLGDLNITPWSPFYAVLEENTGLVNAARGKGYLGTWPTQPGILRIPIDHCLVSDHFTIVKIRTGPDIGSDHLPLIVDIAVADNAHRVDSTE